MRPGATRIESFGSLWFLDDDANEYLRIPKREGPRDSPPGEDWGGPDAGGLQDLVWHPMFGWEMVDLAVYRRLVIYTDAEHEFCVTAPVERSGRPVRR